MAIMIPNLIAYRDTGQPAAVVFVHGFTGHPEATWGSFPLMLTNSRELDGWDVFSLGYVTNLALDLVGLWQADPDLRTVADLLRTDAEVALSSYRTLALVAHSMGGLAVQRALVDDADFARRVSHVVLFGTPSAGLDKASWFGFLKRQVRDLAPASRFITDLRGAWDQKFGLRRPFELCVVAGDQDEFVPRAASLDVFPKELRMVVPGNHTEIVKPRRVDDLSVQVVVKHILGKAAPAGPWNAMRQAVESRHFASVISRYESHPNDLDEPARIELALALDAVGRGADAIKLLETEGRRKTTDAMGVLAGRLKRRWLVERTESDADKAYALYAEAFRRSEEAGDHGQAFYHGINVAFLDLVKRDLPGAAKNMAGKVLVHCAKADPDYWRAFTEGEAYLYRGEKEQSLAHYREAVRLTPPPRGLESAYLQAVRVTQKLKDEGMAEALEAVFRRGLFQAGARSRR